MQVYVYVFSFSFVRYWIPSFTRLVKRCKLAIFSGWCHGETRYFYRVFSQLERILRFFISSPPSKMKPRTRFCRPTIEQQERRRENEIKSARHFAPIVNSGLQHCNHCFFFALITDLDTNLRPAASYNYSGTRGKKAFT